MPFADDYTITQYVNEDVQPTGTPDISAENLLNTENGVKELYGAMSSIYSSHEALEIEVEALAGAGTYEDTTFITGLRTEWVSGTQLRIKAGACYIPAAGIISVLAADTVITPASLAASTRYYIYAINLGGNLTFETNTTVPAVYLGTAKQKTGDASRRYIDSFLTNSSGAIYKYLRVGDEYWWLENMKGSVATPFRVTDGNITGRATVVTNVPCAGIVPPTSKLAYLLLHMDRTQALYLGNSEMSGTLSTTNALQELWRDYNGNPLYFARWFPLDSSQQFNYIWSGTPATNEGFITNVSGFMEQR